MSYRKGAKLSTTYSVQAGDTFSLISRKEYGVETKAADIARANPGAQEPLAPGTVLTIPTDPTAPVDLPSQTPAADADEVAILINGQRFRFWDTVRITSSLDSMDSISFGAPFDSTLPGFKDVFRPFSYPDIVVTVGGSPLFTGTLVMIDPTVESRGRRISVSGYATPGVLGDCTSPASAYPLEFDGQGLKEIAESLVAPFGVGVDFQAEPGAVFDRVASAPNKKVLDFLVDLAKQRNVVISSNEAGELLFWKSVEPGQPVARLTQGETPLLSVTPNFLPQEYYSHITGIAPVLAGLDGPQFTVLNPRVSGVIRPITFNVSDTVGGDVQEAVEAQAGRMFGNAASYSVSVDTWRDPSGALWAPNTTIILTAPDAMVYEAYEFVIRSVSMARDKSSEAATLDLVLPGAFSGKIPEALPWD